MWRSVFLHEFIDHRVSNFQALDGRATPASLALQPGPHAIPGVNSLRMVAGTGFDYAFDEPMQRVIGISCRVRVKYDLNFPTHMFPVIRLGSGFELLLWPQSHPIPDLSGTLSLARVWVGNGFKNLGNILLSATHFMDLRFDWHTSGQARILINGQLAAYHNAVAPGAVLPVDRVAFGLATVAPGSNNVVYHVSRVFVRVLERQDSFAHLSKFLPKVKPTPDYNRCRLRITGNVLAIVDRLRQFMAAFHQSTSQVWTQQAGPASGPFQQQAIDAHALSTASVAELVRMLRTGDYSKPERFLDPFAAFLRILRAAQPAQFATLAAEIEAAEIVPDDCREALSASVGDQRDAFAPLIEIMTEAADRVRQVAGGN